MPCRADSKIAKTCRIGLALLFAAAIAGRGWADDQSAELDAAARVSASRDTDNDERVRPAIPSEAHIRELIRQLGNARYTVRRSAANELRQIGPEAFDLLHAATNDADPEVAASARYLLRQITVRWVRSEDSPAVRRLLLDFGDLPDATRSLRVEQLAILPGGEGLAGLCRIARFDRSPLVSRAAALAIIRPDDSVKKETPVDPEIVAQELGPSTRVAATWLHQYLKQLRDPDAAVAAWQSLIDEESARLDEHGSDTSSEILLGLLWNAAEVHRQLDHREAALSVIDRMIAVDDELVDQTAVDLLLWITKHKSWDLLDEFLSKNSSRIEQGKRSLYFAALARAEQGKTDLADELAERAVKLDPQSPLESFWMAKELEERNKFDWAVREYRHVIDKKAIDAQGTSSHEAIICRVYLSSLLFDHAQNKDAADVLEPLVKQMQSEERMSQLYAEIVRYHLRRRESLLSLPEGEAVACRSHFYRACQYHDEQDWQRERDELELAIRFDKKDADVLIAMFRSPEANDEWMAATRTRIRDLCQQFQQAIDESPSDPSPYNQWAWLVANTEGDFQKAIRYSHRSIELIPPGVGESASASFLDTLGRCYYAAGDYENAVKYQRQAVEKIDYMQVMQRQLALFEKALAEKHKGQGAASEEQGTTNE